METSKEMGNKMSKSITVVTTFHPAGLSKYGQRMIDSFALNIDKRIKLLVYAEAVSYTHLTLPTICSV